MLKIYNIQSLTLAAKLVEANAVNATEDLTKPPPWSLRERAEDQETKQNGDADDADDADKKTYRFAKNLRPRTAFASYGG